MADISYLTPEGLENLKKELSEMKTKGRADIARQIAEARDKGDLSENAEYDAAKNAQGMLEMRISKLEEVLASARIIDSSKMDTSRVLVLCTVKVKNLNSKTLHNFMLVSENEADVKTGRISVTSPIGKGLLGKAVGEIADIQVPNGVMKLEIMEISR